ncbi:MAG: hypothetical protein PHX08_21010 [Lachnospiraceae bacterium]|nr:hypothetical protein [Lachnospiraceae bacterium]
MDETKIVDVINGIEVDLSLVYRFIEQDKSIDAIKFIMEQSGIGLKEAKDYVDRLRQEKREVIANNAESDGHDYTETSGSPNSNGECLKELHSHHKEKSKHPILSKVVRLLAIWGFWGAVYGVTHIPVVRESIIRFVEENSTVDWLRFWSDIILNDLHYIAIINLCGSVVIIMQKKKFSAIKIYNQGLGFIYIKTGEEIYADYGEIRIYYTRGDVCIKCKKLKVDERFKFDDFTMPDVMKNNLERFAKWNL